MSLMPVFDRFPKEGEIIGKLVVGYGELEIDLVECLTPIFGSFTIASRVMYRLRSEGNRFDVGDAVLRPYYEGVGLGAAYANTYSVFARCKKIRNNHAHCLWADKGQNLFFATLEEIAKTDTGEGNLTFYHVDIKLLTQQLELFEHCQYQLWHLRHEAAAKKENKTQTQFLMPKELQLPPLHNPRETSPRYSQGKQPADPQGGPAQ